MRTGSLRRNACRNDSAGGLHDVYTSAGVLCRHSIYQMIQVMSDARREIRIHNCRRATFILTKLGKNAMGSRDRNSQIFKHRFHALLGLRICKAEEQRDRHRLRAAGANLLDECSQFFFRRRAQDFSFGTDPLRNAKAQLARNKTHRQRRKPVIELRPRLAADGDGVFEPSRCHKRNPCAGPLQHGVGSHRCSMTHIESLARSYLPQSLQHRLSGIMRRGKELEHLHLPVRKEHAVGKCSAGIDRYAQSASLSYA